MANFSPFTPLSETNDTVQTFTNALLTQNSGIMINPTSIVLNESGPLAVNYYDGSLTELGIGAGVLLTSGGVPPTYNTQPWYSIDNSIWSGFYNGDPDIDKVVNTVFPTVSYDATTLSFDFTVADPTATSISFDLVFGTDEYPEWVDTVFVDSAITLVNGENYALFNHNPANPLSVISSNLTANYFQDNYLNILPIEYDGVSHVLKIIAPITPGGTVNHIKIGIGDTGDHIYDSGLFLANFSAGNIPGSGIVITPPNTGTSGDDNVTGSSADEYFDLKEGNDACYAGAGDDIVVGGSGDDSVYGGSGNDNIEGDSGNDSLDGGDGIDDTVVYLGSSSDFSVTYNSLDSSFAIVDNKTGAESEGSDTLKNFEYAKFSNGLFILNANGLTPVTDPGPIPSNSPGLVLISGIGSEGNTLTATVSDANGVSSLISYQWQVSSNGGSSWSNIGTNSNTYTVTAVDVGKTIQVIASYTDGGSNSELPVSSPKNILEANNGDLIVTLMQLTAPPGATIINPLTTLIQDAIDLGVSPNVAVQNIKTVLGLPPAINLLTYDAWSILQNNPSQPDALLVEQVAVQAAILTSLSDDDTGINLTLAILNAAANNQTLNLANANDLASILGIDISGITDKNLYPQPLREIYDRNKTIADAIVDGGNVNDIENEWQDLLSIQDNINSTSIGDLSIHINQIPKGNATAQLINGMANTDYIVSANDLLVGFSDPDSDQLSISDLLADNGTVSTADGLTFTITPNADYSGPIELSYQVTDGLGGIAYGYQLFVVDPLISNHAPQLTGLLATLSTGNEDTIYVVNDTDLLTGWTDLDSDSLFIVNLSANHGTITDNVDGTHTIQPEANYNGEVSLNYSVSDGTDSMAAGLTFNLSAINDAPALTGLVAALVSGSEDTNYTVNANDLLAGWTDVDQDTLNIVNLVADHGTVTNNGNGTYTIQPSANYNGPVTLSYGVSDNTETAIASLGFALIAVNDAPELTGVAAVLTNGFVNLDYAVSQSDLLAGWTDVEQSALSITSLAVDHGVVSDDGKGNYMFHPEVDYQGQVTLNYNVSDGTDATPASLIFNLVTANHAPTLVTPLINQAIQYDSAWNYNVSNSFSDQDTNDLLTFGATFVNGNPLPAWLQIGATSGSISGIPHFDDRGFYSLNITATDTQSANVSAPLTIGVTVFNAGQLLISTTGNDTLTGSTTNDTAAYALSNDAVSVALSNVNPQNTMSDGVDTLTGIENLIGSNFADTLTGDNNANILDGGINEDSMIGGKGNDTYVVDNTSDTVVEASKSGTDTVLTWINLPQLANNVENLTLLGSGAIDANGNALANVLTGNSGNNVLDGKSGIDTMFGGIGDDIYVLENTKDMVIENSNEGIDTVQSTVSYTLLDNVENLILMANLTINATGNGLDNILSGSGSSNTIKGMGGNDTLSGNAGNDILIGGFGSDIQNGGSGSDRFRLESTTESGVGMLNRDRIKDFSANEADKIDVSLIDAKSATSKNDTFTWKSTLAFSGAAGELHYFIESANAIVEGDVNGDKIADFQIEIEGVTNLALTDIIL